MSQYFSTSEFFRAFFYCSTFYCSSKYRVFFICTPVSIGRFLTAPLFTAPVSTGCFLSGPLKLTLDCPSAKITQQALQKSFIVRITIRSSDIFYHGGRGESGTLNIFLKSVTYRPTLSKFRGGAT